MRNFLVATAAFAVIGCQTIDAARVDQAVELAQSFATPPESQLAYSETLTFDAKLYQSLSSDLPSVTVEIGETFKRNAFPERMANWMKAVPDANAHRTCVENDGAMSPFTLLALFLPFLMTEVQNYLRYRSAYDYDVTTFVDKESNVQRVSFTLKGTVTGCPANTTEWK